MIHIYTGNGKGKTTAAFGMAIRALGHSKRVYIAQFMKAMKYGEVVFLENEFEESKKIVLDLYMKYKIKNSLYYLEKLDKTDYKNFIKFYSEQMALYYNLYVKIITTINIENVEDKELVKIMNNIYFVLDSKGFVSLVDKFIIKEQLNEKEKKHLINGMHVLVISYKVKIVDYLIHIIKNNI
jgi:cob(I)alamin adenosyltransferase